MGVLSGVHYLGAKAFYNCTSLREIAVPGKVPTIQNNAFYGCTKLMDVTIAEGVEDIRVSAFEGCSGLMDITIPSSVTSIATSAFENCSSLTNVVLMHTSLPEVCSRDAFDGCDDVMVYCNAALIEDCGKVTPWMNLNIEARTLPVEITSAGMATACFDEDLDFTSCDDDVKAYIASGFNPEIGTVLLTRVNQVPAGTGFILKGSEGRYDIPVSLTKYMYANLLVGTQDRINLSETTGSYTNYVLGNGDNGVGFYLPSSDCVVDANKAYLQIPASAAAAKRSIGFSFEDEDDTAPGFISIKELTSSASAVYDINGQRKSSLSKGLNIVDGKTVFIR